MGALDRDLARLLVDELAMRELLLDDVGLCDILEPAGPLSGLQADDTARHLGDALQHYERAGDRNNRLEVIDRRSFRGHVRMLGDAPGIGGVVVTGVDQCGDPWNEKDDVKRKIEPGLGPRS